MTSLIFKPLTPEEIVTRLAAIVDSSEDAIVGTDVQGTVVTWNSAATQLFGYKAEEILGDSVLLIIPPSLHHEHSKHLEMLGRGMRVEHYETQRLRKGGTRVDVSVSISPVRDAKGELIGSAIIARSLEARRREEAALARLAALVESSDDAIVAKDLNGIVTDWNAAAERMFGYTADEIIGRSILTIIPPELQHEEPMLLGKVRAGQRIEHYETQRVHKLGKRLDVSLSISPMRDGSGRIIGASKIVRDISEHRKLTNARTMLAAIVECSDDAIISKNLDGIITSWNAAAERLFGYKAEEIIGQSVLRIIPRDLQFEEPGIIARLKSGERIEHYETRRVRKDGELLDVSLTVSPIRDEKGRVVGGSKILRDVRDRKLAEVALVEKEKFAAAGRLAATLAHEVNNPLESITNLSYLLSQNESLDAEARHFTELLLKEVQRAGDITRQTLGYYRESKTPADVDVRQILEHVLNSKRNKFERAKIQAHVHFQEIPTIKGFDGELRQVFENLIENAIDALAGGGTISVSARVETLDGEKHIVIQICDNGIGIPSESMSSLFEPFFTSKVGKGSGLGLWVSRSIARKHGGDIYVRSNPNVGQQETVFIVELPVAGAARPGTPAYANLSLRTAQA